MNETAKAFGVEVAKGVAVAFTVATLVRWLLVPAGDDPPTSIKDGEKDAPNGGGGAR